MRAAWAAAAILPLVAAAPPNGVVVAVPAGADLQAAISRARPGQTLVLEPGATYVGNFILTARDDEAFITIRTAARAGQPGDGDRVEPRHSPLLARLKSPNAQPVLATQAGAHHWRLQLLEFLPTHRGAGDIIALGDGGSAQRDRSAVPHHLEIDRCLIRGGDQDGQKRGIALNSAETTIVGSHISGIKAVGMDSQAIAGWNGPGPFRIENNYLEAAGENVLFGGADPAIAGLVPSGIVVRGNHLAKPTAWRAERWQVKNLFELKNARDVVVEDNLLEYTWAAAQAGYAVLFTPRNQDGAAPWATVADVIFRRNVVRHAGSGLQITGEEPDRRNGSARNIRVIDNLFYDIDATRWGGAGVFLLIGEAPADVAVEDNTIDQSGNILSAFGARGGRPLPVSGFVFRGNLVRHNAYGVHGADRGVGLDTIRAYFPGAAFEGNALAGGDPRRYPPDTRFITDEEFAARLEAAVRDRAQRWDATAVR
jgi:hypothetical protein